ncbi:MAG: hypothetical protein ACLRWQ_01960 [Flavonifractor plautii]
MGIASPDPAQLYRLVFYFTSANLLETESIRMMERIASQPFQMNAPGELGRRACPFTLQLGPHGELLDASGGYYDLSDDAFLVAWAQAAAASPPPGGCWRSIPALLPPDASDEPLPGVRGHLQWSGPRWTDCAEPAS